MHVDGLSPLNKKNGRVSRGGVLLEQKRLISSIINLVGAGDTF